VSIDRDPALQHELALVDLGLDEARLTKELFIFLSIFRLFDLPGKIHNFAITQAEIDHFQILKVIFVCLYRQLWVTKFEIDLGQHW